MKRLVMSGFLLAVCLFSLAASGQAAGTVLNVTVADAATGILLPNAQVLVRGTTLGGRTDILGEALITGVPEGVHTVEARLVGYGALSTPAKFSGKDSLHVTLLLLRSSQSLPTVTVRDSLSRFLEEFDNRRRKGLGRYITQADLKAAHGRTFGDLLQSKMPGIRIRNDGVAYSTRGPNNRTSGLQCPITVWYNGVRGGGGTDITSLDLLGGVEYYTPAYVPVQFRDGAASCGVLLLWSGR